MRSEHKDLVSELIPSARHRLALLFGTLTVMSILLNLTILLPQARRPAAGVAEF